MMELLDAVGTSMQIGCQFYVLTFTDLGTNDAELLNTSFHRYLLPKPRGITASATQTFASLFGGSP
jgi:hypothetical protein